ncbi:MAG: hypothetical protein ACR2QW_05555 [bacterium]
MSQLRVQYSQGVSIEPCLPLHERVPTHDEDGKPLSDFMMLIPGLKQASSLRKNKVVAGLQVVLDQYREVIFADLNVSRSVLWVSVRAIPGIIPEIAGAIQIRVPEALIVGSP